MEVITLAGTTLFKFNRVEKKWREKGYGDISFLMKDDVLMVGVGKHTFFVKGGIRPKGPNAIVMRVWGAKASSDEADQILAVRFGSKRDSKRLLTMLSDRILDKRKTRISRESRTPGKPPPPWFVSLGRSQQKNIQSMIKNAITKHLNDGTIQRQLATMYKLSPKQTEEAISYFHPWHGGSKKRNSHYRGISSSMDNSASSLPSVAIHVPLLRNSTNGYHRNMGKTYPLFCGKVANGRSMLMSRSAGNLMISPKRELMSPKRDHSSRGNLSDLSAQLLSPGLAIPAQRQTKVGQNPNKQLPKTNIIFKNLLRSHASPHTPDNISRHEEIGNSIATPKGDLAGSDDKLLQLLQPVSPTENKCPSQGNERSSAGKPTQSGDEDSILPISPLTEHNLVLLNKLNPPLKGDYRTIVRTWLRKSAP